MNELENYLQHSFCIDVDECRKLADMFTLETYLKGEYYLKSRHYCNKLSFIQEGLFRVFVTLPDREVTQWICTKGYFLTDMAGFFFREQARWNIQALTDCRVYTIDYELYCSIGKIIPKWNELEKLFIGKCFVTLENRVFNQISLSAEERYQLLFDQ